MKLRNIHIPQAKIEAFCRRWQIKEMSLFGSVLREDFRPESDVDVLITLEPGVHMTLANRLAMLDELADIFGRQIDLVEKKNIRNPFRRHDILATEKVIYAT
ncbi:nucleotidyltransferase family protein [Desulfobacca acetoxidans]|uniref:DNA polymerase beta domain protein region n=1 Tax=Desulfobacca acetoxidans (strain ATCC 700848 / DSM 11109 / ASRB2) TaxID=880072 RepID=F2NDQ1_DESAR|nr:nucleotidyltransferase domain-containing protein [Desulfobacca acetoxidans]AEB10398.1 DNA polymerase beta domain protein region [Desulfobacca acetoxidans DSM 11109]